MWWVLQEAGDGCTKKKEKMETLFWNVSDQSSEIDNGYNLANFAIYLWREDHL